MKTLEMNEKLLNYFQVMMKETFRIKLEISKTTELAGLMSVRDNLSAIESDLSQICRMIAKSQQIILREGLRNSSQAAQEMLVQTKAELQKKIMELDKKRA